MIEGTFEPLNSENTLSYNVESWWDLNGNQHDGSDYTEADFMNTDRLVVRTTDGQTSRFSSIQGPFEDQEFIEDILAYDYGPEGTLQFTSVS